MLIPCNNKGCMQTTNALLNKETKEVICQECGKPVANITEPMRRVLLSSGQILRTEARKAFMMACRACNANREVVLTETNATVCGVCGDGIVVHAAMKQAIMEAGKKVTKAELAEKKEVSTEEDSTTKKTRKKVNRKLNQ